MATLSEILKEEQGQYSVILKKLGDDVEQEVRRNISVFFDGGPKQLNFNYSLTADLGEFITFSNGETVAFLFQDYLSKRLMMDVQVTYHSSHRSDDWFNIILTVKDGEPGEAEGL